jgi:hypothetical protein
LATPSDRILKAQELELEKLAAKRAFAFLRKIDDARKELYRLIASQENLDTSRLSSLLQQVDAIRNQLVQQLRREPPSWQEIGNLAVEHSTTNIVAITQNPTIAFSLNTITPNTLRAFSEIQLKNVTSIVSEQALSSVKSALFQRVGVQGVNPQKVAKELVGKEGLLTKKYAQIENVIRTEANTVYNTQTLESILFSNATYGTELNKKIYETLDAKRNHPISQLLNGLVQEPDRPFRVPVASVDAKAAALKKSGKGVFWPVVQGFYVGQSLPAHYRERGKLTPSTDEISESQKSKA